MLVTKPDVTRPSLRLKSAGESFVVLSRERFRTPELREETGSDSAVCVVVVVVVTISGGLEEGF